MSKNNISICVISKNEEKNIGRFLSAASQLNAEIVLVDTGSTDNTIKIAKNSEAKIYSFDWVDDFSAARNYSIKKASNDTVLILDCDEFVLEADTDEICRLAQENADKIGLFKLINLLELDSRRGAYTNTIARMFNRRYYHYEGRIHEQIKPIHKTSDDALSGYILPLTVEHIGYALSKEKMSDKHKRNLDLLLEEIQKNPNDPYINFQIGQEYYNHEKYEEALPYYEHVIKNSKLTPGQEYHRLTVMAYGDCLLHLNKIEESKVLDIYLKDFGYTPDLYYLTGVAHYLSHDFLGALGMFVTAVSMNNPAKEGTNTYMSWYYIGLINEQLNNYPMAIEFYKKCGEYDDARERLMRLSDITGSTALPANAAQDTRRSV
ncbi:MAG: glycosyltransferase [Lachnospiraceae bacterium]|nr:glycosyltransferase [Lachnospiraceae bacterium]